MTTQISSTFTRYSLTDQESLSGSILHLEQKLVIQNFISEIAEQKLALIPDPNNYPAFIQQEAHMAGQIAAYKYLLDSSLASEQILLENAKAANS